MDITGRMERMRTGARQRMMELRADRAESQNEQLKVENRVLRDEIEGNRSERQRVLDLLEKAEFTVEEPTKRRFRLFRLLLAAGAIYAVGTRTGAFQRVKGWMNGTGGQLDGMAARGTERAAETAYRVGDVVEHTGRKIQKAGERVEQAGDRIEQVAKKQSADKTGQSGQPTGGLMEQSAKPTGTTS
jgi:hypothetical protein